MAIYNIQKTATKAYLHEGKTTDGGTYYYWSSQRTGALRVSTRQEGKDLIRTKDPNTAVKDISLVLLKV